MTGYGQGAAERDGGRAVVEIRAVNHRFLDLKMRGASLDTAVEEAISSAIRQRIERGSVTVGVRLDQGVVAGGLRVDVDAARRMYEELSALRDALGMAEPVSLRLICAQPGVLVPREQKVDIEVAVQCVSEATAGALDGLVQMREAEGAALAAELGGRLTRLSSLAEEIAARTAGAPEAARRRLNERLQRMLRGSRIEVDEARLAQEIALLADRLDITEELVRLRSHLDQAGLLLSDAGGAVGRKLEFLAQEMGREVNTIAAKSQSAEVAHAVVAAKAELEKIREQVQNVE